MATLEIPEQFKERLLKGGFGEILYIGDFESYEYKGYIIHRIDYVAQSQDWSLGGYPRRVWWFEHESLPKLKKWELMFDRDFIGQIKTKDGLLPGYWTGEDYVIFKDFKPKQISLPYQRRGRFVNVICSRKNIFKGL